VINYILPSPPRGEGPGVRGILDRGTPVEMLDAGMVLIANYKDQQG